MRVRIGEEKILPNLHRGVQRLQTSTLGRPSQALIVK